MPVGVIVTDIELGTLAALLTAIEFFLGVVSSLAARATLHGLWLLRLHRGATERLDVQRRERRIVRKDALATALGVWLVLGVALVESNLQAGFRVEGTPINSKLCVSVFGRFGPRRVSQHLPSFRTMVEPWVLRVAEMINCAATGIVSVGVGGTTDSFGMKRDMLAPICAEQAIQVSAGEIVSRPGAQEFEDRGMFLQLAASEAYMLFPHDKTSLGTGVQQLGPKMEGRGICGKFGLSGYLTVTKSQFQTLFVHTMNMTAAVHNRVCQLHGSRSKHILANDLVEGCFLDDEFESMDNQCLRRIAEPAQLYKVVLSNMSALFIAKKLDQPSYACIGSNIEYEYVLVQPEIPMRGENEYRVKLPVIMPTRLKPLNGHCERTIAPLAQAALIYTLNSEWTEDELSSVPRITRFHAYTMAVSASQYPLHKLQGKENATNNGQCLVRPVKQVTEIPKDWRFALLMSGLVVVLVISTVALVFRFLFKGEAWAVGSARWSLDKLLGSERGREALIEVVPVAPKENTDISAGRASLPTTLLRRSTLVPPLARNAGSGDSAEGGASAAERVEYRLRTLSLRQGERNSTVTTPVPLERNEDETA